MLRVLLICLLCPVVVFGQEPTPAPIPIKPVAVVAISVGTDVTGTGKKDSPYLFDKTTKCVLRLTGTAADVEWDVDDAPPDIEVIDGRLAIFSLASPGLYQVTAHGPGVYSKCWFTIHSGTDPPPRPVDSITSRVKAALAGKPTDAAKFGVVCTELAKAIEAGQIDRLGKMETSMKAGLDAVGWIPGTYPDLSKLAGELFGRQVADRALTTEDKATFATQLRTISAACQGVK